MNALNPALQEDVRTLATNKQEDRKPFVPRSFDFCGIKENANLVNLLMTHTKKSKSKFGKGIDLLETEGLLKSAKVIGVTLRQNR